MHDLAQRGAPLEYWFFRTEVDDLRLLVDLIVRRSDGTIETHVACTVGSDASVAHDVQPGRPELPIGIANATASIDARGTAGDSGGVSWDLDIDLGRHRIQPVPSMLAATGSLDMLLISRPAAALTGTINARGRTWELRDAPGMVAHYWGRALAPTWCWVSVVGPPGQPHLEAAVLRSRLWGSPATIPGGYAWLWSGQHSEPPVLFAMPSNGSLLRRRGGEDAVSIAARRGLHQQEFSASADGGTFVPFGDRIRNSQCATFRWGERVLTGSLEFRDSPPT